MTKKSRTRRWITTIGELLRIYMTKNINNLLMSYND